MPCTTDFRQEFLNLKIEFMDLSTKSYQKLKKIRLIYIFYTRDYTLI